MPGTRSSPALPLRALGGMEAPPAPHLGVLTPWPSEAYFLVHTAGLFSKTAQVFEWQSTGTSLQRDPVM